MKIALLTLSLVVGSCLSSFGQGAVVFKNFGSGSNGSITPIAFVYDSDGTTKLSGTGYSAQLFYGAAGSVEGSLVGLPATSSFLTGAQAGLFGSPTLTIPGVAIGATAVLQVRVWNNAGGTITSYDAAAIKGASSLVSIALGDPGSTTPGAVPTLVGLTSFTVVPEPATLALAGIGGLGLLALRRKTA